MYHSEAFEQQLRAHYAAIAEETFVRARHCLTLARAAHQAGDCAQVRKWIWCARVLRMAAVESRKRAQRIAPVLVCALWCLTGCGKTPALEVPERESTASFEVQASADGSSVVWSLQFKTLAQYHAFLDATADGADRAKIHELIAAGMRLHHIVGCSAEEKAVTKLGSDGIAFVGSCPVAAHATLAIGGI
jgi:hypothetical protein